MGMAHGLHIAYGLYWALLHGSEAQSLELWQLLAPFLLQKPGNLRETEYQSLHFLYRATICLNLAYKVSYFFFSSLKIWFFNAFKQALS